MKIPAEVAAVLKVAAPTLAAALAGPFAPLAAGVVSAALRQWLPDGAEKATPIQVAEAVRQNGNEQSFMFDLRKAELDLQKFESEMDFRFAELEVRDRQGARDFARDTGSEPAARRLGYGLLLLDGGLTVLVVAGAFLVMTGYAPIRDVAVFTSLMTFVSVLAGRVSARADTYVNFVFGSSAGSKEKTEQIGGAVRDLGDALARSGASKPLPPPEPPVVVVSPPAPGAEPPVRPADWRQGPFGGRRWRLAPGGVVVEGEGAPMRTVGQPATARRIWADFGPSIAASCAANGVPLELVVATIATESRGRVNAALSEPDGRQSVGLMQTLTGTASEVLGREVGWKDLLDPTTSIEAGTRYIAKQRGLTEYQPPLVAAAYNAGGLHPPRAEDANPWRLRSTGDHITRFCQFYGDACAVAAEDGWGHSA